MPAARRTTLSARVAVSSRALRGICFRGYLLSVPAARYKSGLSAPLTYKYSFPSFTSNRCAPSSAFKYSVSCVDASPMHAILVEASGPSLIALPLSSAAPVNRLHEPLPATFPASGNASVARESAITGLPPRSSRLHCRPAQIHSRSRCGGRRGSLRRCLVRRTPAQHRTQHYTQAQRAHSVFHGDSFSGSARCHYPSPHAPPLQARRFVPPTVAADAPVAPRARALLQSQKNLKR